MNPTFSPASVKSAVYVIVQFIIFPLIAISGRIIPANIFYLIFIFLMIALALWAMIIMKFNFNAAPDILPDTTLKIKGPYKLIRHPMYTSLFGIAIVWLLDDFSYLRLAFAIVLFIDLFLKMDYEEKLLSQKFPEYPEYKKRTKRIIPFLF